MKSRIVTDYVLDADESLCVTSHENYPCVTLHATDYTGGACGFCLQFPPSRKLHEVVLKLAAEMMSQIEAVEEVEERFRKAAGIAPAEVQR